ncbi:MAG: glutamate ABC transporter substrate-binding protein [Ilumatobacteraceae bacterium]
MSPRRWIGLAMVGSLVLAGCSGSVRLAGAVEGQAPPPTDVVTPTPPACSAEQAALDPTRSYEPTDPLPTAGSAMPAGSAMEAIQRRGKLIVGVSGDTLLFGARNALTNQIEGFDIDMLKEVAKAIFGDNDIESHITYKVITYADRLPNLEAGPDNGGVDIVAHTMTINCNRWLRIAFSSEYFDAGQRVLVKKDSGFDSIGALNAASATVCAPEGSTNIDLLRDPKNAGLYGNLVVLAKPDVTDCLVAMQQGQADGATGDDTVLAGLKAQDPNTEVVGDKFTREPYGLGMAKDKVDFVRFVNGVLEEMRTNGRWQEIYSKWLIGVLSKTVIEPPTATYGRDG